MLDIPLISQWAGRCPQIAHFVGDPGPHLIHDSLNLPKSRPPNGISIASAVLAQLMVVTNRHTNHITYVTVGCIYAHINAMRPNNSGDCFVKLVSWDVVESACFCCACRDFAWHGGASVIWSVLNMSRLRITPCPQAASKGHVWLYW